MPVMSPTPAAIVTAAEVVRAGGVVVIPTETVYGLACNALMASAVRRVYDIKGRPSENPLIVHVATFEQAMSLTTNWSPTAERLARAYWPGPLTLILPKADHVPSITTGGLDSVAIRMPRHPVAKRLIELAECPIAAPSANVFMGLSPTSAEHIDPEILLEVDIILDGGPCEIGLESTVIDVRGSTVQILRPGAITRAEIQALIGRPLGQVPPGGVKRGPGMYPRHYAPRAIVKLVVKAPADEPGLVFGEPANDQQIKMPADPKAYGANLYAVMRRLDQAGNEVMYVELPPELPEWEAVNDRLRRASGSPF